MNCLTYLQSSHLAQGDRLASPISQLILSELEQLGQGQSFVGDIFENCLAYNLHIWHRGTHSKPFKSLILSDLEQLGQGQSFVSDILRTV